MHYLKGSEVVKYIREGKTIIRLQGMIGLCIETGDMVSGELMWQLYMKGRIELPETGDNKYQLGNNA